MLKVQMEIAVEFCGKIATEEKLSFAEWFLLNGWFSILASNGMVFNNIAFDI